MKEQNMYKIPNHVWDKFIEEGKANLPKNLLDSVDEAVPDDVLTLTFKERMHKIFDKVMKIAGVHKPLKFIGGQSAFSRPLVNDTVFVGTGLNPLPDGAIAAVMAHELAHFKIKSVKGELERMLAVVLNTTGSPSTVAELKADLTAAQGITSLFGDPTKTKENYLKDEMEADRIGVQWALKAGFQANEIKEVATLFEDDTNKERIPAIEETVKKFS